MAMLADLTSGGLVGLWVVLWYAIFTAFAFTCFRKRHIFLFVIGFLRADRCVAARPATAQGRATGGPEDGSGGALTQAPGTHRNDRHLGGDHGREGTARSGTRTGARRRQG